VPLYTPLFVDVTAKLDYTNPFDPRACQPNESAGSRSPRVRVFENEQEAESVSKAAHDLKIKRFR
jgi:hypothetical protein